MPNSINLDNNGIMSPCRSYGAYSYYLSKRKNEELRNKEKRNKLKKIQRKLAPSSSMRCCNLIPIDVATRKVLSDDSEIMSIAIDKQGYRFQGMVTCNNAYCVTCSKVRMTQRAKRIHEGLKELKKTYQGYFVTLTMPRSNSIKKQLDLVRLGWKNIQRKLDRAGYKKKYQTVRGLDLTFSPIAGTGTYHLHIHAIFMIQSPRDDINELITSAWMGSVKDAQLQSQKIELIKNEKKLSWYVSKMSSIAFELSNGNQKETRTHKSLSLPELMEYTEESPWAVKTYQDFLLGMKGKKTITFSRGWPKLEEQEHEERESEIIKINKPWYNAIYNKLDDIGIRLWADINRGYQKVDAISSLRTLLSIDNFELVELNPYLTPECQRKELITEWINQWSYDSTFDKEDFLKMHK
jgi:hypothetical protein